MGRDGAAVVERSLGCKYVSLLRTSQILHSTLNLSEVRVLPSVIASPPETEHTSEKSYKWPHEFPPLKRRLGGFIHAGAAAPMI